MLMVIYIILGVLILPLVANLAIALITLPFHLLFNLIEGGSIYPKDIEPEVVRKPKKKENKIKKVYI